MKPLRLVKSEGSDPNIQFKFKPTKTFLNEYFMKNKQPMPRIQFTNKKNHLKPSDKKSEFIEGQLKYYIDSPEDIDPKLIKQEQDQQYLIFYQRNISKKYIEDKIYEKLIKAVPKINKQYKALRKKENEQLQQKQELQQIPEDTEHSETNYDFNFSSANQEIKSQIKFKNQNAVKVTIDSLIQLIEQNFHEEIYLIDRENVQKYEPKIPEATNECFLIQLDIVQKRSLRLVKSDYYLTHHLTLKDTSDTLLIFAAGVLSQKFPTLKITVITKDHFGDVLQNLSNNIKWRNPEQDKIVNDIFQTQENNQIQQQKHQLHGDKSNLQINLVNMAEIKKKANQQLNEDLEKEEQNQEQQQEQDNNFQNSQENNFINSEEIASNEGNSLDSM